MPIGIHGDLDAGMPELLLDVGQGFPILDEQGRECVAKLMEPDSPQSRFPQAFLEVPIFQVFHILETALFVLEYPARCGEFIYPLGKKGFLPVTAHFQKCHHQCIGHIHLPDLTGLREIDLAAHNTSPHPQELTIFIQVAPLETGQFTGAQSGVDGAEEESEMLG